jgi:hypothetical protein
VQSRLGVAGAAAVLAVVVAAGAAACSSGGSGNSSSSASSNMDAAQELAATLTNSQNISSFTATMSVKASGVPGMSQSGSGDTTLTGNFSYQKQPSELAEFDASSLQSSGMNLGSMSTITTPSAIYLKMTMISALMHSSKPWLELPVSELKSGGALSALISQAQSSNPLSDAQLLGGAKNVRTVGTSTIDGVAVTEIDGSEPATAAIAKLPASLRTTLGQNIEKLGIGQIKFQAWVDGQHDFRKLIVNEVGSSLNETVEFTVNTINQPVNIAVPSAGQATTIPASALSGAGGL